MNDKLDVKASIKDTLPTVFGYIGIGIAFGIIASSVGLSPFFVGAMSLFIYAGGAQFITVSMLSSGAPILSIILATFLINSRMILMSMAIAPFFKRYSVFKNIVVGTFLTDESFALGMNKQNYTRGNLTYEWFNTANLISYFTWFRFCFSSNVYRIVVPASIIRFYYQEKGAVYCYYHCVIFSIFWNDFYSQ